jgi:hypothetical protein
MADKYVTVTCSFTSNNPHTFKPLHPHPEHPHPSLTIPKGRHVRLSTRCVQRGAHFGIPIPMHAGNPCGEPADSHREIHYVEPTTSQQFQRFGKCMASRWTVWDNCGEYDVGGAVVGWAGSY